MRLAETDGIRAASALATAPDPAREQFDALQRRIAAQRALLAEWQGAIEDYERRYVRDVLPLLAQYRGLHVALLERLDHAASGGLRLGRTEAQALHELIVAMADGLLAGEHDAGQRAIVERLRARYADTPTAPAAEKGDPAADPDDPEALLQRLEAERAAAEAERARQRSAHRRQAAARKKQRAPEAVAASQSLRAVYRQLASALHPDREADPDARRRKTALMQQVNAAYAAERLSDLLQLQQQVAEDDSRRAAQAGTLPPDRLASYNRLLADQLAALQREVRQTEADFKARHGLNPHGRLRPSTLAQHLRVEQAQLANGVRELQREQRALDDPAFFKQWLKAQRQMARRGHDASD